MESEAKLDEIESEILKIFDDCKSQGMSKEEIIQVFSPLGLENLVKNSEHLKKIKKNGGNGSEIQKPVGKCSKIRNILLILGCFGLICGLIVTSNGERMKSLRFHTLAIFRIALIKVLPYWNWQDIYYSRCLVPNPFFETPDLNVDDCNICETMEEMTRVSNVTQSTVIDEFIRREKPFIVTDAMEDWPIMKTDQFWFDNITEIYIKQENYRVCNVNTNLRVANGDFTRVLKKLYNPRTREWFIHMENCQKELAKHVRQFYRRPYFISNSLDFTGSNWVLMSSDFRGRVYKKIEARDSLLLLYQIRGFNQIRLSPRETCRGFCPELTETIQEGEILVVTNLLWIFEYIPGEFGDNLAIISEVSWPSME